MKTAETKSNRPDAADSLRPEQTVAEIVIRHPCLRERLEQLGIDYCCGGKRPFAEAVERAGLELNAVLENLGQALLQKQTGTPSIDWTAVSLTVLADHILVTHHVFTKTQLARIDALLAKGADPAAVLPDGESALYWLITTRRASPSPVWNRRILSRLSTITGWRIFRRARRCSCAMSPSARQRRLSRRCSKNAACSPLRRWQG